MQTAIININVVIQNQYYLPSLISNIYIIKPKQKAHCMIFYCDACINIYYAKEILFQILLNATA